MFGRLRKRILVARKNRKIRRETPEVWRIEDTNLAYIQIPKIATRSIRACLTEHLLNCEGLDIEKDHLSPVKMEEIERRYAKHMRHRDIMELKNRYCIFAFVRNPLERLFSCYKNKVLDVRNTGGKNIFYNLGIEPWMSFQQFVEIVSDIPDYQADRHFRSQHWFLNYRGQPLVDKIFKMEEFDHNWGQLAQEYGLPSPPHRNKSRGEGQSLAEVYDAQTLRLAMARYGQDLDQYGYRDQALSLLC